MRLPVATGVSSGGSVAVVELSTIPGREAAEAGPVGATAMPQTAKITTSSKRGLVFTRVPFP
ncbi:hypothetical protein Ate02nite_08700 [Paractinoplanes tereljensis]|uniref:Uncharacterized protein n=1 Tax=Paractinoplanes tereljensis TaxID=571912 RepID=A0A919TR84_9ACTN|nr:hypothetical protein Ate02nite_08700 [Actinoplanes tereljensis]